MILFFNCWCRDPQARELISSAMLDWLGTGDPGVLEESGGTGKKSERWTGAEGNVLAAARDTQEQRGGNTLPPVRKFAELIFCLLDLRRCITIPTNLFSEALV